MSEQRELVEAWNAADRSLNRLRDEQSRIQDEVQAIYERRNDLIRAIADKFDVGEHVLQIADEADFIVNVNISTTSTGVKCASICRHGPVDWAV